MTERTPFPPQRGQVIAEDVLGRIYAARAGRFKPKITIWMHSGDIVSFAEAQGLDVVEVMRNARAGVEMSLFGERLILSDDTPLGLPTVEVSDD